MWTRIQRFCPLKTYIIALKTKDKTFGFYLRSIWTFRFEVNNMPTEGKIAFSMLSDCPQILTVHEIFHQTRPINLQALFCTLLALSQLFITDTLLRRQKIATKKTCSWKKNRALIHYKKVGWLFRLFISLNTDSSFRWIIDDIETDRSTGSDYWAALCWLSENQNKRP